MFKVKSHNISDFPFEEYAEAKTNTELVEVAVHHRLSNYNQWMLPQLVAYWASWQLVWQNNRVNSRETCRQNMTTPWAIGTWRVATQLKRSSLVATQTLPDMTNYSTLVPLILSAHKRYNGVPYAAWDLDERSTVVAAPLLQAMMWRDDLVKHLDRATLLQIREQGLTIKTGDHAGTTKNPTQQWCLRGISDTSLGSVPTLVATMLTQIWVCHPSLRTNLMVLDPYNWDAMPEPLVSAEIFEKRVPTTVPKPSKQEFALPWET